MYSYSGAGRTVDARLRFDAVGVVAGVAVGVVVLVLAGVVGGDAEAPRA